MALPALAPIARDQIGDPGRGLDQPHVFRRKPRAGEPLRHGLGRDVGVPGRVAGVDLDQLLEDFTLECPRLLLGGDDRRAGEKGKHRPENQAHGDLGLGLTKALPRMNTDKGTDGSERQDSSAAEAKCLVLVNGTPIELTRK